MNNKGTKKEPLVQKRGFMVALYCCLAAMLVLAAVISYNNYTAVTRARELRAALPEGSIQAVGADTVPSYQGYLTPADRGQATTPSTVTPRTVPKTPVTPVPTAQPTPKNGAAPKTDATQTAPQAAQPQTGTTPQTAVPQTGTAPQAVTPQTTTTPAGSEPAKATPGKAVAPPSKTSELSPPIYEVFTDGNTMNWPVLGEVVMDFSEEHTIYDKTLEQYRTNEVLCIATDIGSPVHAATGGVVREVDKKDEMGNTVVIDHGNGWTTTYSQLQDGVLVKTGDVVNAGQVIGGVGSPSRYYVLLGNHLGFSVARDDSYLDPKSVLE